jgi:hypothetical protein
MERAIFDGSHYWLTHGITPTLTKWPITAVVGFANPPAGTVMTVPLSEPSNGGFCFDGVNVWLMNAAAGTITKY